VVEGLLLGTVLLAEVLGLGDELRGGLQEVLNNVVSRLLGLGDDDNELPLGKDGPVEDLSLREKEQEKAKSHWKPKKREREKKKQKKANLLVDLSSNLLGSIDQVLEGSADNFVEGRNSLSGGLRGSGTRASGGTSSEGLKAAGGGLKTGNKLIKRHDCVQWRIDGVLNSNGKEKR